MTEITTVAIITAKPGSADELERVLAALARAALTETGSPRYTSQRGLEDPHVFITLENWDSQESVQTHLSPPHLAQALCQTAHLLATPPQIIYVRTLSSALTRMSKPLRRVVEPQLVDAGSSAFTPTGRRVSAAPPAGGARDRTIGGARARRSSQISSAASACSSRNRLAHA